MPIANIGRMTLETEMEIIRKENAKTNAQLEDQEEFENDKDKRMKENELKKEMKKMEKESGNKRALSDKDNDNVIAKKLDLFLDGNNIEMDNISQEITNEDKSVNA